MFPTKSQLIAAEFAESVKTRIWRTLFGKDMRERKSGKGYQGQSDFEIFKDLTKALMDVFDPAVGLEKSRRMFGEAKQRNRREPETEQVRCGFMFSSESSDAFIKLCPRLRDTLFNFLLSA